MTAMRHTEAISSFEEFYRATVAALKQQQLVVFCGAGISKQSGLPLANEMVGYTLERLDLNRHERALGDEGLVLGRDYEVHYRDEDLDAIDWNDSRKFRLVKIHGSVADERSMAITLRQVASRAPSNQRQAVVDHAFSRGEHTSVLVLGYSCSDLFDISPQIEELRDKNKRILFVDHSDREAKLERVSARRDKNPFRDFPHGTWLVHSTDATLKAVWRTCLEEPYQHPTSPLEPAAWQRFVDMWYARIESEPGRSFSVAGHLFLRLPEARDAIEYFDRAVNVARRLGQYSRLSTYLSNLALAYTHAGNYREATRCHEEGLRLGRTP